jgi:hypothetical protein
MLPRHGKHIERGEPRRLAPTFRIELSADSANDLGRGVGSVIPSSFSRCSALVMRLTISSTGTVCNC